MTTQEETKPAIGYHRVPVTDITMDDADMPVNPLQRFDWTGLGDKAVALAKTDPTKWQLVGQDVPTSTASNITAGKIVALNSDRFTGWRFRGRCSEVKRDAKGKRAIVWIRAIRDEPVL